MPIVLRRPLPFPRRRRRFLPVSAAQSFAYAAVFLGDSITRGTGASSGAGTAGGTTYPGKVMEAAGAEWTGRNTGNSSDTLVGMLARLDTDVYPYLVGTSKNAVLILGGINDISLGADAATTYARLVELCEEIRADEPACKIIVGTILPTTTGALNTERAIVNASIRANWQDYSDALMDFAFDDLIGDDADASNATYYGDGVHPTDAGYARMGLYAASALAQAIVTTSGGGSGVGGLINGGLISAGVN